MPVSQKTLQALAKGRAVQASRRAALKAANLEMVEDAKRLGISHLGEMYVPDSDLLARISEIVEGKNLANPQP